VSTTNINIRVDSSLKKEAEDLFRDLGLNPETEAALAEYEEMKKNPGNYKRYNSFKEAMDEVLSDA
jgi:DNA-damage-inducible protein J